MAATPFWKVQSIGNDFPLIREPKGDLAPLAIRLSDRRFGIGGDGLLTVRRDQNDLVVRMFNPDGTEDFCGNGIRAAAWWAHTVDGFPAEFNVRHGGQVIPVRIAEGEIATTLGPASYDPDRVPVVSSGEAFNTTIWSGMDAGMPLSLFGSALTTGSTHTVIPTSALPDDDSFLSISPKIETSPAFPQRTSVIWSQTVKKYHLKVRIWERGVGETLGCGTGSSAAVVDYLRRQGHGGTVTVENPGGTIRVQMDAWNAPITILGPAEVVYEGEFTD